MLTQFFYKRDPGSMVFADDRRVAGSPLVEADSGSPIAASPGVPGAEDSGCGRPPNWVDDVFLPATTSGSGYVWVLIIYSDHVLIIETDGKGKAIIYQSWILAYTLPYWLRLPGAKPCPQVMCRDGNCRLIRES